MLLGDKLKSDTCFVRGFVNHQLCLLKFEWHQDDICRFTSDIPLQHIVLCSASGSTSKDNYNACSVQ